MSTRALTRTVVFTIVAGGSGCDGPGADLPRITPPVKAALPAGLGGSAVARVNAPLLDPTDIQTRFFSEGPTSLYRILGDIDQRIDEINGITDAPCLTQDPVPFIVTAWGQSVTAVAQCHQLLDGGLVQFGRDASGVIYIYSAIGDGRLLAEMTPLAEPDTYSVHAWLAVGVKTPMCGTSRGSYGVIELVANEGQGTFEMTVAGTGFGYCGAQLRSDGASVYFTGSRDMMTCTSTESTCGAAADVATSATCGATTTTFSLPALGRVAGCDFAASDYPGGNANVVTLDGMSTDAVLSFGPISPTPGTGAF